LHFTKIQENHPQVLTTAEQLIKEQERVTDLETKLQEPQFTKSLYGKVATDSKKRKAHRAKKLKELEKKKKQVTYLEVRALEGRI
jgi:hypothetical protein